MGFNKTLSMLFFLFSLKLFSQVNTFDPIIDNAANYIGQNSYNIGEVYVIFEIAGDQIMSKSTSQHEIVDTNTSINTISIYPNPINDILNIATTDGKDIGKVYLYSMDGRKVKEMIAFNNQIDLTGLPNGTYILKTEITDSPAFKIIKL